jgi:hypothetical protein
MDTMKAMLAAWILVCLGALALGVGTAAAQSTGIVMAWGSNDEGQCDVPEPDTDYIAVVGGWDHSLGLKSDGTVVAWGDSGDGQCDVPEPNADFVAVAAGRYHSVGLKSDGTIVAWGDDSFGQCNVPSQNADFVAIAAGALHSLGLRSDGTVACWGYNGDGQCSGPTPNADLVAVASGWYHTLGLRSDGTIVVWGDNSYGQCSVPSPNADFVAVAGGGGHSLALRSNGTIAVWGYNGSGQWDVPEPNAGFVAIAGGGGHSLALRSAGTIAAWGGNNSHGQCDVPVPNAEFAALAAGRHHSLGIRSTTGQPAIVLSDTLLAFGPVGTGVTVSDTLDVMNGGDGWLFVDEILTDDSDFSAEPVHFFVGPGEHREVTVAFCPSSEGSLSATMTVTSNDPDSPVAEVALEGEGVLGGQVVLSDTSLEFGQICVGSPVSEPLVVSNSGFGWLTVSEISTDNSDYSAYPTSFPLPPGGDCAVQVQFTPGSAGPSTGILTIHSDDPVHPAAEVALDGEGVGSVEIATSDTLLVFGAVCVNATSPELLYLGVYSEGVCPLVVSDIGIDNSDFSVDVAEFTLAPEDSRHVCVAFDPSSAGPISGTLTILSTDPEHPAVEVALEGEGLAPPEIAVSPDSLSADLLAGATETQFVTIENTGTCDLVWYAYAIDRAGARREEARDARLADLTGVEILWDKSHGQNHQTHTELMAQLESRGATVTENTARFTHELLSEYTVVWFTDCTTDLWQSEVEALSDWLSLGNGLLLEGDGDVSTAIFNGVLEALGIGIEYSTIDGADGLTTCIHPHWTTQDVGSLYLWNPRAHLSAVTAPAVQLVDDHDGVPNSACAIVESGRVVTMASDLCDNFHFTYGGTELFANQVFDWLAAISPWIALDPHSGTLPGPSTVDVSVTLDASGLAVGSYEARLLVYSNDLDDPEVSVPIHLRVMDAPDIAVSDALLAFGEIEVGTAATETLLVWNEGTALLTVSGISSDHPDFSAYPTSFALLPEESAPVVVEFVPSAMGSIAGSLTIVSDDPDEGSLVVAVGGTGTSTTPVENSLYATETEAGTVLLRWVVQSLTEYQGFNVYRATSQDGPFARVNTDLIEPGTPGSFEDTGVWPKTSFWYELLGILADGTEETVGAGLGYVTTGGRLGVALYPASPNPFTAETHIRLDVPTDAGRVLLAVYDIAGRRVRRLDEGRLPRGRHVVRWDGRDDQGRAVSSGVYLVRLEAEDELLTRKLLLVK